MASGQALWAYIQDQLEGASGPLDVELDDLIPIDFAQDAGESGVAPPALPTQPAGPPAAPPMLGGQGTIPTDTSPLQGYEPGPEKIGFLERPGRAFAELLQGGDPVQALVEGKASLPSLGYRMFPGAAKKGFQAGDIPAFAIDAIVDPLNLVLPFVFGKAFQALKIPFKSRAMTKFFSGVLDEVSELTSVAARKQGLLKALYRPLGKGRGKELFPRKGTTPEIMSNMVKDFYEEAGRKIPKEMWSGKVAGKLDIRKVPDGEVDWLLSRMRNAEFKAESGVGLFNDASRFLSMKLMPVVSVLRNHGGKWGTIAAQGIENIQRRTLTNFGNMYSNFSNYAKELGLLGKESAKLREAATLWAEGGGRTEDMLRAMGRNLDFTDWHLKQAMSNPKVAKLGKRMREMFDYYTERLSTYRDSMGRPWYVQLPDEAVKASKTAKRLGQPAFTDEVLRKGVRGGRIPFEAARQPNYVPHMWNFDELKQGKKGYQAFLSAFAKKNNMTTAEASLMIQSEMKMFPKRFGNIEYLRHRDLGGYIMDPLEYVPKYLKKTEYRMAFAEEFGAAGHDFVKVMDELKKTGLDNVWLDDVTAMVLEKTPKSYQVSNLMRKATALQVLTKMGLGSTIANASQSINTITRDGVMNFIRGVSRSLTDDGAKTGAIAYSRAAHDSLNQLLGIGEKGIAAKYLDAVGFGFVEKWNRFFAANSGHVTVTRLGKAYQAASGRAKTRIGERLAKYGVKPSELRQLENGVPFGREVMDRVALMSSEITQHATHWHQLPKLWQTPEAKLVLQYKNFAYNQTRFVFQEIFGPAFKYLQTGGAAGTMAPFLRFAPLFIGAGQGVAYMRDFVRRPVRGVLTGDWKGQEKMFWESDDPLAAMARDTLMVGSVGILGDLWTATARGKALDWLAGPTLSDLGEFASKGAVAMRHMYQGEDLNKDLSNFKNWMYRRTIPGVAAHTPWDINLDETLERLGR